MPEEPLSTQEKSDYYRLFSPIQQRATHALDCLYNDYGFTRDQIVKYRDWVVRLDDDTYDAPKWSNLTILEDYYKNQDKEINPETRHLLEQLENPFLDWMCPEISWAPETQALWSDVWKYMRYVVQGLYYYGELILKSEGLTQSMLIMKIYKENEKLMLLSPMSDNNDKYINNDSRI